MTKQTVITSENISEFTEKWLQSIAPYQHHQLSLNVDSSALLVIDMQNYFIDCEGRSFLSAGKAILPNVQRLIAAFRDGRRPVIFTRHAHNPDGSDAGIMGWWWGDMIREGYPEAEVFQQIAPQPGEKIIAKHRYSAFYNTDFETVLRCTKIEDLVVCGVMTNLCCESTARDAYCRDYRVFFLADATATVSEELHLATLMNLAYGFSFVCTTEDVLASIRVP